MQSGKHLLQALHPLTPADFIGCEAVPSDCPPYFSKCICC